MFSKCWYLWVFEYVLVPTIDIPGYKMNKKYPRFENVGWFDFKITQELNPPNISRTPELCDGHKTMFQ